MTLNEEDDKKGRAQKGEEVEEETRSCHPHGTRCAGSTHSPSLNPTRRVAGSSLPSREGTEAQTSQAAFSVHTLNSTAQYLPKMGGTGDTGSGDLALTGQGTFK